MDAHAELLHLVILLCSTQLYDVDTTHRKLTFNVEIQELAGLTGALTTKLLRNAVQDLVELKFRATGFLSYIFRTPKDVGHEMADMSLFLLLLLSNQEWKKATNPFRDALKSLADTPTELPLTLSRPPAVPFDHVYELLCR